MQHFLLIYHLAHDYSGRRQEFRSPHLRLAWEAQERGELMLGGAVGDPPTQAILVFAGESDSAARRFVLADPYVKNGLVQRWEIHPWQTVVGEQAANPIRPD